MTYSSAEHERGLVDFVVPQRRDRFRAALAKGGKARSKELSRLHEGRDIDDRWVRPLGGAGHGTAHGPVLAALDELAPGAEGYLVAGDPALDGRFLDVADALEACAWADEGALMSVVPGRVAVWLGELVDSTRLLIR